ncbi:hypothetical protein [Streptomyces sp. 8N706]|uniref:hypothetical protein n=1 Tax=Streptomyces sp. 8N706 TaxID=3457416 RepID=UPI003FD5FF15
MHDGYAEVYGLPEGAAQEPPGIEEMRTRIVGWLGRGESELRHLDDGQRAAALDVMVNNVTITSARRPDRFRGTMLLVVAARKRQEGNTPEAWKEFLDGELEVHEVDCEHPRMLEPQSAAEIGRIIAPRIAPSAGPLESVPVSESVSVSGTARLSGPAPAPDAAPAPQAAPAPDAVSAPDAAPALDGGPAPEAVTATPSRERSAG